MFGNPKQGGFPFIANLPRSSKSEDSEPNTMSLMPTSGTPRYESILALSKVWFSSASFKVPLEISFFSSIFLTVLR